MLIQADEMVYETDSDRVVASGNVEIYYDGNFLAADKVIYDQKNDSVHAVGNVRFRDPAGTVTFTDDFTVTGDFREGFVRAVQVLTPENARIVAADAQRLEGNVVVFNKAVYTACEPQPGRPDAAPMWRIKAARVVHNQEEQIIEMRDAVIELFGLPIAWFPYFQHPDPTVKRKSGFLFPRFRVSSELGASVHLPYFWVVAPNQDITYVPVITSKQGILHDVEWRHRLDSGAYSIRGSGIYQLNPDEFVDPGNRDFRGMLRTKGLFHFNKFWSWGWSGVFTSDETFPHVYDLITEPDLVSNVFLTGLRDRNFFEMKAYHFERLRGRDRSPLINEGTGDPLLDPAFPPATGTPLLFFDADQPLVHPVVDYNFIFPSSLAGGELGVNVSAYSLTREFGADATRMVTDVRWRRQFTDQFGQRITPFFDFRGDVYRVDDVRDFRTGLERGEDTILRGMATAGVEYRYPFISTHSWGSQVIEPVAQLLARPDQQDPYRIPNEDARSLVFDDTILFDRDKFSGFDRTEGGTRANVGLKYTVQTNRFGYGSLLFGQSYHLAGTNPFTPGTGLADSVSDWVGALYVEPTPGFSLSSRVTLDNDEFTLKRHELDINAIYGPATAQLTYVDFRNDEDVGEDAVRQELLGVASLAITDNWSLFGGLRYDVDDSRLATAQIGLGYICDCGFLRLDYAENYFEDRDDEPDRRITLTYFFKTLGGGAYSTSVGQFSNDLNKLTGGTDTQ